MTDFLLPDLGEGLQEAEIVTWKVSVGDEVREGDDMVEMSTAKAVVEVPSPFTGKITKLHGAPGDIINTGGVLVSFALEGETESAPSASEDDKKENSEKQVAAKAETTPKPKAGEQVFKLPDLGEGLPDAEIVKWCVSEGDDMIAGEPMVEMSTAKAVVEVPAPFSGTVIKLFGAVGDVIETGSPLISASGGEGSAESTAEAEPIQEKAQEQEEKSGDAGTVVGAVQIGTEVKSESSQSADGIKASPAVRAIARKLKVDMRVVSGSGANGEVTMSDVKNFAASGDAGKKLPTSANSENAIDSAMNSSVKIGPAARALAESLGLDLSQISPTGDRGTVTKQDVILAARTQMISGPQQPLASARSSEAVNIADAQSVLAAPKVRAYARDNGIDLRKVQGTGPKGSVSLADANAALKADFAAPTAASAPYQRPARAYEVTGEAQKLVGPRRVMAQAMAKSNTEVCHTSIFDEADIAAWPAKTDITVRIMRAIIAAAMVEPAINAHFNGETFEKTVRPDINLGVGVDSDKGLFVPVIRNAEKLDAKTLRETLNNHRKAIAENKITPQDMSGATITLSNFGMIAGKFATPIVSIPQVAIVGIGGLYEKLVMTEKGIVNHRFMPISLTFDHRACTGGEAARYLGAMIADLEMAS